ncbi:hypothetical protein [Anaerotignum propionicum]|uniref:hypothetical protein n=1 Tax=Anaerotignum propionicum TaxID=28446 RepID=UPI00289844EE|nr:hypothetical protein [Anaerotignum propionicum]
MLNLQNDPIYRNADRRKNERRMKQEKRKAHAIFVTNIKVVALWLLYAVIAFGIIAAVECALPHRILLKWIIIFSFFGASAPGVYKMEKKIKKSLRNCNSERDKLKNSL